MKIYTKTGDKGKTKLVDGSEVSKAHPRIESYGTIDELNSVLGLALCELKNKKINMIENRLSFVQNELFNLGSILACDSEAMKKHLPELKASSIEHLEKDIDQMTSELPPLKEFILPGGSFLASYLHLGRTVCRRAERHITLLFNEDPSLALILQYVNRLSDYLFVAARYSNFKMNIPDQVWQKDPK